MRSRLTRIWDDSEKIRYLIVGGWNTLFGWGLFFALYALLGSRLNYLVIACMSHVVAVTNAFVCHRFLVFRSDSPWLPAYLRFNVTHLFSLLWGLAALAFLVQIAHLSPPIAQCFVLGSGLVLTYVLHRRFSFHVRR
jgi:putative flippase GtrA